MGNNARVNFVVLGVVNLKLQSRDCLSLGECRHAPSLIKEIILVSSLDKM